MTPTILIVLSGLGLLLVGVGLLGTLLGVRATIELFGSLEIGFIMAGYYAGYVLGTLFAPRIVRNVGHIRSFSAFAALGASCALAFGLLVDPWVWFVLRVVNGICVVGLYMVVESWLNEQSAGPARGRIFASYMMSTLFALAVGQILLLADDPSGLTLFALSAILISLGLVPVAMTRVTEPRIDVSVAVGLGQLFRISPLGAAGALGAGAVNGMFWGMAPVFGQRLALDEGQIATLMSATILGGALLQWPIGHVSDRVDRRTVLVFVSFATAAVATVAGVIVVQGRPGVVPSAFLYGGLMFSLYGLSVAHTNDHLHPGQVLEATRGLLLMYGLGALAGPLLGGLAMQEAGPVGLPALSAATAALLGLFGAYRMVRSVPPPTEAQGAFVSLVRTSPVVLAMHPEADPAPELDLTPPSQ
ncbi:MAG: MFS transporter [Chromatiaceae bacterium]